MEKVVTDFSAGTLSDEDREDFLKERGLWDGLDADAAQAIRDDWPDEDILMVMGAGLF